MKSVAVLLNEDKFLKALFEGIPCGVFVVDHDGRVKAVNNVLERAFGLTKAKVIDRRGGGVLRCVHVSENPQGCGYSEYCRDCQVQRSALEALAGRGIHRNRADIEVWAGGKVRNMVLLVSAAPVEYEGEQFAIVVLEDVTELNTLRKRLRAEQSFSGIVGHDPTMQEVFLVIRELAEVGAAVLIQGESGTGKELVAAAIHNEGPRASGLFVPVNCSALPEGLLESELFGHVRGAFTGAHRDKKGRFELADGGTIFLDEVGDLSPAMQVKLLRVLQEGAFERVGGEKTIKADVRVISATNKDLRKEVAAGRFREDLFYRLCVVPVLLPPLRERRTDIPLLVDHILRKVRGEAGRPEVVVSQEALGAMMDYDWPGNVRELQNALQYAMVKCRGDVVAVAHLPPTISGWDSRPRRGAKKPRKRKLRKEMVRQALQDTNGNKAEAARKLRVGRATLYRFLNESGMADGPGTV